MRSDEGEHDANERENDVHEERHGANGLGTNEVPNRGSSDDERSKNRFADPLAWRDEAEQYAPDKPYGQGDHHPVTPLEIERGNDHRETHDDRCSQDDLDDERNAQPNDAESATTPAEVPIGIRTTCAMRIHRRATRNAPSARRNGGVGYAARGANDGGGLVRGRCHSGVG